MATYVSPLLVLLWNYLQRDMAATNAPSISNIGIKLVSTSWRMSGATFVSDHAYDDVWSLAWN
ncbi:hypothetical protein OUZ56_021055 [Daphnia magna]|uniref:Uncharacterized protein n=1 Tax=Daphnia magna TaxID=35525 RepID=A0ABQ9ZHB1_9CRUS|nr:hypothetical protein OUZ56_021055 [Daphnia magna]